MYRFTTSNDTEYKVEDGRITRFDGTPLEGLPSPINGVSFRTANPPTIGERFCFTPKGWTDGDFINTSRVVAIEGQDMPL